MGAVTWASVSVPVIAGRVYSVSLWSTTTTAPLHVTEPGKAEQAMPIPVGGWSSRTFTPTVSGVVRLRRGTQVIAGVRVHEGIPDRTFYATEGTPTRVAVADPERTYQLVTDQETRIDYSIMIQEVGDYPGAVT